MWVPSPARSYNPTSHMVWPDRHMKRMLSITNHQGHASQNQSKMPLHTCRVAFVKRQETASGGCGDKGALMLCGRECNVIQTVRGFLKKPAVEPSCSVTKSCPALCDPMDCSTPGFSFFHCLPEFAQSRIHRVGDAVQPSHPLSSIPFCPQFFPASESFSSESALHIRWPEYWSLSFNISPSSEYSGFIYHML